MGDGLAGNSAQEMEAELEVLGVERIGERLKGAGLGRHGETVGGGEEAAVGVHFEDRVFAVAVGVGEGFVPLDVDGDDGPAVGLEVLVDEVGVVEGLFFSDAGTEAVPGVPTHGRGGGPRMECRRQSFCGVGGDLCGCGRID